MNLKNRQTYRAPVNVECRLKLIADVRGASSREIQKRIFDIYTLAPFQLV